MGRLYHGGPLGFDVRLRADVIPDELRLVVVKRWELIELLRQRRRHVGIDQPWLEPLPEQPRCQMVVHAAPVVRGAVAVCVVCWAGEVRQNVVKRPPETLVNFKATAQIDPEYTERSGVCGSLYARGSG